MSIVLDSTKKVVEKSDHVSIATDKAQEWSDKFLPEDIHHWLDHAPFDISKLEARDRLHYIFVFNSISFCYWGDPKWKVEYQGKKIDGAYGMSASLGKALEGGYPVTNFRYLAELPETDFEKILEGEGDIPLFENRLNILREVGSVVSSRFNGDLMGLIQSASSAEDLLEKIITLFPSFRDQSNYKGEVVHFYKRAQLLIADIFQAVESTRSSIKSVASLTACADYKLPQMLRKFGILTYSDELIRKIADQEEIAGNSSIENEIRANTIWAIEMIRDKIRKNIPHISSVEINDYLWLLSQNKDTNDEPYHRTKTISY